MTQQTFFTLFPEYQNIKQLQTAIATNEGLAIASMLSEKEKETKNGVLRQQINTILQKVIETARRLLDAPTLDDKTIEILRKTEARLNSPKLSLDDKLKVVEMVERTQARDVAAREKRDSQVSSVSVTPTPSPVSTPSRTSVPTPTP